MVRADPRGAPSAAGRAGRSATSSQELIEEVCERVGSPREARWIVEHVESEGGGRGSSVETPAAAARALAARRAAGEPLQYVLGRWPFRTLDLAVDRRVLIPRPETEQLVDVALAELTRLDRRDAARRGRVAVDLGTGSGAIALSLATEGQRCDPSLEVWATDRSPDALAVAQANLSALGPTGRGRAPVHLVAGRWFEALPRTLAGAVDLVVSNPPYVGEREFEMLEAPVADWEPVDALRAGPGTDGTPGLADIEEIVATAPAWLHDTGVLVVELAPHQAGPARAVAEGAGFRHVSTAKDLAGRTRFLVARRVR